jgi:hypothetical protein
MITGEDQARLLGPVRQAIVDGDWRNINARVEAALAAGVSAETVLGRAMKMGLELIKPRFVAAAASVGGTVEGDFGRRVLRPTSARTGRWLCSRGRATKSSTGASM